MQSRAPEKSNFSNTFARYLKENGDLTLGRRETDATMNLFPMADSPNLRDSFPQKQPAQMTIFYAGQVIVFDDLPPEKANQIMMLAGKGTSTFQSPSVLGIPKPDEPSSCAVSNFNHTTVAQARIRPQRPQPDVSDLPIARKASLTRFLEKRKDRITARSPYQGQGQGQGQGGDYDPPKQDDSKTWLGLAAQSHVQFRHPS